MPDEIHGKENRDEKVGGLSLISTIYSSSSEDSEDEVQVTGVVLNQLEERKPMKFFDFDVKPKVEELESFNTASINLGGPTNFGDVKIKEEPVSESKEIVNVYNVNAVSEISCLERIKTEPNSDYPGEAPNTAAYRNDEPIETSDSEPDSNDPVGVDNYSSPSSPESMNSDSESETGNKSKKKSSQRKPDFSYDDLPPIEDLHISVPHEKCKLIGTIKSVVEPLVVVESVPNVPVLNLDSVLFLDEGDRALGSIFDVIGNVKEPYYCVRFNSKEHIEKNGVHPGMKVYCAPNTDYTAYVFLAQLRQMKGSDASWKDDVEAPPEEQEFSDDEAERMAKNGSRKKRQKQRKATAADAMSEESTNQSNYSNGNSNRRGFKRPLNNYSSSQPQNMDNNFYNFPRTPFVPPYVAGFTPPHATRPPYHRYNNPRHRSYHQSRPGFNTRMPYGNPPNNFGPYPSYANPLNPPYQQYNMWADPSPQQNYWQNGQGYRNNLPPTIPRFMNSSTHPTSKESESADIQPPPPGV